MSTDRLSVTNFAVQYSGASASEIAASEHDLVIVEAAPGLPTGDSDLSDAEVASLVSSGIEVIGYVSIGQTDDARPYWDPAWTNDGLDTGDLTASAPVWVAEIASSWPARYVEYWNDDWKAIVMDQVTDIVTRGYSGIFLDNILTYYEIAADRNQLGTSQSEFYATEMIKLVVEIAATARAINPDFAVIANGGPYILGDAAAFGTALVSQYLIAIDGIMAESFFGLLEGEGVRQVGVLDTFESFWAAIGIDVLALEYSTDPDAIDAFVVEALERGFSPSVSPDQALNTLPPALITDDPDPETEPEPEVDPEPELPPDTLPDPAEPEPESGVSLTGNAGNNTLKGTALDDKISGKAGNDIIFGRGSADELLGGTGKDNISGGAGSDVIKGGAGADTLNGNKGQDRLFGGRGEDAVNGGQGSDTLFGGKSDDDLMGGRGKDQLFGGRRDDELRGGKGSDTLDGGQGADELFGGRGIDRLDGGRGKDEMTGGGGADTFIFNTRGTDTITDFQVGRDKILIRGDDDFNAKTRDDDVVLRFENGSALVLEDFDLSAVDDITFI